MRCNFKPLLTLSLLLAVGQILFAAGALAEKRVALVIGNGAYPKPMDLPNGPKDAKALALALERLGFEVVSAYDLPYAKLNDTLKDFSRKVSDADVGLFFYSGHGMQAAGENYLIPVDAKLKHAEDLDFETVKVNIILRQMLRGPKVKIVLLDACRDNPLAQQLARDSSPVTRSLGPATGLGRIDSVSASGTLIAFATAPGSIALDGSDRHSPFTAALLKHIETPDVDIDVMMKRVRGEVVASTGNRQEPFTESSLTTEFFLNARSKGNADGPRVAEVTKGGDISKDTQTLLEVTKWQLVEKSNKVEDYQKFLKEFPNGHFSEEARAKLEDLSNGGSAGELATASDEIRAQLADESTEKALNLAETDKQEINARLALLGFAAREKNRSFTSHTRGALRAWQVKVGLVPTGYLNAAQRDLIKSQSESVYTAWNTQGQPSLGAADNRASVDSSGRARGSSASSGRSLYSTGKAAKQGTRAAKRLFRKVIGF
jgi:hypothetical protein